MLNSDWINYKLLAIDLDGTLLTRNKKITKEDMAALKAYANLGGEIFISTGKCLASTLKYVKKIEHGIGQKLNYCASLGGTIVYDLRNNKILESSLIESDTCKEIYDICRKLNMTFVPYIEERDGNKKTFIYRYAKFKPMRAFKINAFVSILGFFNMKKLLKELLKVKGVEILTTQYFFYEIVKVGSNKGTALEYIANKLDLDLSSIASIGDSHNDLPMFKVAGTSFLVRDKDSHFKKFIDVLVDVKKSRIAHIINEYVLNGV